MASGFIRRKKKILILIIVLSVVLHVMVLLNFGAYRIFVEELFYEEKTVVMPEIMQMRQLKPEYTVNLELDEPEVVPALRELPPTLVIKDEALTEEPAEAEAEEPASSADELPQEP